MTTLAAAPSAEAPRWSRRIFQGAVVALTAASWISAALFGAYILAFYGGALPKHDLSRWNENLPNLYGPHTLIANIGIGAHFLTGGILLVLGPVQLVGALRRRMPVVHRWSGRLYVTAAALAGLGGLAFLASKSAVGGLPMSIGFGVYGLLMLLAAAQTYRHGAARRIDQHRAWGVRLFALAIGSWLYRMEYGFWLPLTNGLGHTPTFSGPFDMVMDVFFYIPNLAIAELFLRVRQSGGSAALRVAASTIFLLATGCVIYGTYYFVKFYWGPGILGFFAA